MNTVQRGHVGHMTTNTASVHLSTYLAELVVLNRADNTIRTRSVQLHVWCRWLDQHGIPLDRVTRNDVVDFLSPMRAPETQASYRAAIRTFHQWLSESGHALDDPTRALPQVHRGQARPRPIPDNLVRVAMMRATPAEAAMITLGRLGGMRASEIAGAHSDYLQGPPEQRILRFCGKGRRWRELPAHPAIVTLLGAADGWLFPSPVNPGSPLQPDTVSATLSRVLPGDWTGHSLRHRFATEAYRITRDIRMVQEWLGHASVRTTSLYIEPEHNFDAIRSMGWAA